MEDGDDEDVLWEGSPLYKHLQKEGMVHEGEDEVQVKASTSMSTTPRGAVSARHRRTPAATSKRLCAAWPKHRAVTAQLEVEVARRVLESELLVQEDEDFVNNFILTEEAIELARKSQQVGCS